MSEFRSPVPLPDVPDNLSIPQFILRELSSSLRPIRPRNVPFFIEDSTGRGITYEEAHRRTYGLANALSLKWNIRPKDVVCLFSPNHTDYATVIWAVHTLGGIITPANPTYTADELKHQLSLTKAKLIAVHSDCLAIAKTAARACGIPDSALFLIDSCTSSSGSDIMTAEELIAYGAGKPENYKAIHFKEGEARTTLAFLSFSSGTTGKPKAVAIPHYSVIANIIQMTAHHRLNDPSWPQKRISPGDIVAGALPFFHIYGLVVIMHFMLFCGASIVVIPKFNFSQFLESIARHRITHLYVVPPQVVLFCKHPAVKGRDFSHVKFCTSGAAPLNGELMMQLAKLFPNAAIGQGYGLTETVTTVCSLQPERMFGTIGSAGTLVPGITAKVVKSDGTLASEGEQGELVVKGPAMALGYYENPTATAETFADGWVRTGDEVIIKDLEIYVVDRLKEIMKVRGFQVAPAELEGHLLLHHDVGDTCVVGIPDEYSGEVPMAFIVPNHNALERIKGNPEAAQKLKADIQKHVSDAKVQYKWLTGGIQFVDAIPKNPSGKILRRILRDQARAAVGSGRFKSRL
ncbi:amp dependent CoA ligase [Gymnopilus junonius]|uniref:Amp dependent CoA ligase n=1 Tax=Gymnopilus junonius TaxID=109634 RepID=A0A9P5TUL8_GYMJU|nr:amp dependent CoA ligase [Gymnopilus junonius]